MKKNALKNFGTINIENLEVLNGRIEVFIPVEVVSQELNEVFNICEKKFREKFPKAVKVDFNVNLVFNFGFTNPEFELQIMAFDENQDIADLYDCYVVGDIDLTDEQRTHIKKVMWNKMGEFFLNM